MKRRSFLCGALSTGTLAIVAGAGLLRANASPATDNPESAFAATSEAEALRALFGPLAPAPSERIRIEVPSQAMYGKGAACKVWCDLEGVEVIAVLTRNNRYPLNTFLRLSGADAYYSTRIRVEETSPVSVYVRAGSGLYFASATIKVSHGGYGMHPLQQ